MNFKTGILFVVFLLSQWSVFGQKKVDGYFYDTLVIMDYTTNDLSERLSRLRKPLKRNFFLKSEVTDYKLFQGDVVSLSVDQLAKILDGGFSLYFDKEEYQGHKNLKPGTLEVLSKENEVVETLDDLGSLKAAALKNKLKAGVKVRLSDFIVSVNEKKHGPIQMDVVIIE